MQNQKVEVQVEVPQVNLLVVDSKVVALKVLQSPLEKVLPVANLLAVDLKVETLAVHQKIILVHQKAVEKVVQDTKAEISALLLGNLVIQTPAQVQALVPTIMGGALTTQIETMEEIYFSLVDQEMVDMVPYHLWELYLKQSYF